MNTLFAAILITLSLTVNTATIPPLTQNDSRREWITHPSGVIIVHMDDAWVVYSAMMIPCNARFTSYGRRIVFGHEPDGAMMSCYLLNVDPIGYYLGNPETGHDLKFIPIVERTWK